MGLMTKLFGTRSQREIKKIQPMVDAILALEPQYKQMSEEELLEYMEEYSENDGCPEDCDAPDGSEK